MEKSSYNEKRVANNMKALRALKSQNFLPEVLKNYSGWGGLREAIYTPKVYLELKKLLGEDKVKSIKKTLKSAYFTPKFLVDFIYSAVVLTNLQPESVLEPCAGRGAFFENIPAPVRFADITAVEIEQVNCSFLRKLYKKVNVHECGFEDFNPEETFDLIVGNPPFGQFYVQDEKHSDLTEHSIHHYFVAKCMRLLREGGVLAMVLPRYFLDNSKKHVREIIAEEGGSLLFAYRLPQDLFEDAQVTVDLVFLKKSRGDNLWLKSSRISEDDKFAYMNDYFLEHPENVLGKIEFFEIYDRSEIKCCCTGDIHALLHQKLVELSNNLKSEQCTDSNFLSAQNFVDPIGEEFKLLKEELFADIKDRIDRFEQNVHHLHWLIACA